MAPSSVFASPTALLCCLGASQAQTNTQIERERERERERETDGDVHTERERETETYIPRDRVLKETKS